MLDVDPECWNPRDEDGAPEFLKAVMHGVITGRTTAREDRPPSDAVREAHVAVLEVVVEYLAAGRRASPRRRRGHRHRSEDNKSPEEERVLQFFAREAKGKRKGRGKGKGKSKMWTPVQSAQNAVEISAAWAVRAWGSTAAGGSESGAERTGAPKGRHERRRQENAGLVRARLVAANLLGEVVETCGLPTGAACRAILAQMDSFAGDRPDAAGAGAGAAGAAKAEVGIGRVETAAADAAGGSASPEADKETQCRGLGAAARGGLVRALLGRPFCAELSRVLRDGVHIVGDGADGVLGRDVGEIGRLRALLSRVIRRADGGAGALLL